MTYASDISDNLTVDTTEKQWSEIDCNTKYWVHFIFVTVLRPHGGVYEIEQNKQE